ncbi:MAG TPA: cytochrome c oxidase assembly protein [Devosia sp.]|jgi:putative membrane protein|uniref:cytochrome c oxidase assembly protein n=1 Tax=Devosia sp. TaxID=1871048 RepID=UPI002F9239B4
MSDRSVLYVGLLVLALAWLGPLPGLVPMSFAAHMALHMTVVGIGVPLVAIGLAPMVAERLPASQIMLPIVISLVDLVVVWGWHAPALHDAARSMPWVLAIEQACFFLVSLAVWVLALASTAQTRMQAALAGALSLFFTSMHMTLLGALLGLAPRPMFSHVHQGLFDLSGLADQQLGGVIMLAIGGVIYLAGGLSLVARALRREAQA